MFTQLTLEEKIVSQKLSGMCGAGEWLNSQVMHNLLVLRAEQHKPKCAWRKTQFKYCNCKLNKFYFFCFCQYCFLLMVFNL